jgi:hypothetical protein
MINSAKNDIKDGKYKEALESLKFVFDNLNSLSFMNQKTVGARAWIVLKQSAEKDYQSASYFANLYANGIPDIYTYIFKADPVKALEFLQNKERVAHPVCIYQSALIVEKLNTVKEPDTFLIDNNAKINITDLEFDAAEITKLLIDSNAADACNCN